MKSLLAALVFALTPLASFADEDPACAAMRATFAPKQNELETLKQKRDDIALLLEARSAAGDDAGWKQRVNEARGRAGDMGDADFESLERALVKAEHGFQAAARQFAMDKSQFTTLCGD